jgi:WXG100 family type VII secretion target
MADNGMELGEGTLQRIGGILSTHRTQFKSEAGKLDGRIQERQQAWLGAGGGSFFNVHRAWNEKVGKVVAALDQFEAAVLKTDKDTTSTDQDQASTIGTDLGALDGIRSY